MFGLITRSRRTCRAFVWPVILLCLGGLAAVGLEWVSCGHEHLVGGHSFYHHHLFFAAHEHPGAADHPHRTPGPHPHHPKAPGKSATVSPAPALFQPATSGVLLAPLVVVFFAGPARVLPGLVQTAIQPARPRGPPVEKGYPGCRT
jgi:hypothetical protein